MSIAYMGITKMDNASMDYASMDSASTNDANADDANADDASMDYANMDYASTNDANTDDASMDYANTNNVNADYTNTDYASMNPKDNSAISAVILCGGRSSRMGTDKALLTLGGESFLDIQINKLRSLGIDDIMVSGHDYGIRVEGVRRVRDEIADCGPLGGMYSCFKSAAHDYALVTTVDSPLISARTLQTLIDLCDPAGAKKPDADTYADTYAEIDGWVMSRNGRPEPLLGIYRCGIHDMILSQIKEGKLAVRRLLVRINCIYPELSVSPEELLNCNTPEDYSKVRQLLSAQT